MPARLLLDDALQTYSRAELKYLLALASQFPPAAVIRASHLKQPPAPLQIALELRLVASAEITNADSANEAHVRNMAAMLKNRARRAIEAFAGPDTDRRDYMPCPKCGEAMVENILGKRRHGHHVCPYCDLGRPRPDPALEQMLNKGLQGRGSHYGGNG